LSALPHNLCVFHKMEACGNELCSTICQKWFYCPICLKAEKKSPFCSNDCFKKKWSEHKLAFHNQSSAVALSASASATREIFENAEYKYGGDVKVSQSDPTAIRPHGQGTLRYKTEARQTFTGLFRDGEPVKGTLTTPDLYK
jgi:hypothetical protein